MARQPGVTNLVTCSIEPILGGKFYQWDSYEPATKSQPAVTTLSISGWDPAAGEFSEFYSDSGGNQATDPRPAGRTAT